MSDMLTEERGIYKDGAPYIVLSRAKGGFVDILQEALRKLHYFETAQAEGRLIVSERSENE